MYGTCTKQKHDENIASIYVNSNILSFLLQINVIKFIIATTIVKANMYLLISVITFRNLEAISFDANATCMSNPNWRGCATNWGWTSRRLVLPSEPEIYGI